jgi:Uma2 family endonuclease
MRGLPFKQGHSPWRSIPRFRGGVLPMPTDRHQTLSRFLLFALFACVQPLGGTVLYAPLRLQIREGRFREPDLLLVCEANAPRRQNQFWRGVDLVVEIVSPDDPERDTIVKRADYAEAPRACCRSCVPHGLR